MRDLAQAGTRLWSTLFCLMFLGCDGVTTLAADAGSGGASSPTPDAGRADASCQPLPCPSGLPWSREKCACVSQDAGAPATQGECQANTDCALITRGCCASCLPPSREQVLVVPVSKREDARRAQCPGQVACGPCEVSDPEPLAALLVAACVQHRCELVDLRQDEISHCASDSDCAAVGRGCCPPNGEDPAQYVGLHNGADTALLACFPVPPCDPPPMHDTPIAYCAADGHCAVRRRESVKGQPSSDCFSPTQNLEHAYDSGAIGCDCVPGSSPLCRADKTGRNVALFCMDKAQRESGEDGPCTPHP